MKLVPLSNVRVTGSVPLASPVSAGAPASVPSLKKFRIWSDADCVVNGPGLKLKSSEPASPEIDDVFTAMSYTIGSAKATRTPQIMQIVKASFFR